MEEDRMYTATKLKFTSPGIVTNKFPATSHT